MNTMDLEMMHPHEIVRGLMRGERASLKRGYSAEAAVESVMTLRPELDRSALRTYARGFAAGMAEDRDAIQPVRPDDLWERGAAR